MIVPTPGPVSSFSTPLSWPDALVCSAVIVGTVAVAITAIVKGWQKR